MLMLYFVASLLHGLYTPYVLHMWQEVYVWRWSCGNGVRDMRYVKDRAT